MKILNLHRRNTANVGDLKCAPYLYFPELLGGDAKEILGFRQADAPNTADRVAFKEAFSVADVVIIGGGGLLEIDFFEPALRFLNENKRDQKYVLWGAGHNSWGISDWRKLKRIYFLSGFIRSCRSSRFRLRFHLGALCFMHVIIVRS